MSPAILASGKKGVIDVFMLLLGKLKTLWVQSKKIKSDLKEKTDSVSSVGVRRCGVRKWHTLLTLNTVLPVNINNANELHMRVMPQRRGWWSPMIKDAAHTWACTVTLIYVSIHNSRSLAATRAPHRSPCVRETHRSHEAVKMADFSN